VELEDHFDGELETVSKEASDISLIILCGGDLLLLTQLHVAGF